MTVLIPAVFFGVLAVLGPRYGADTRPGFDRRPGNR